MSPELGTWLNTLGLDQYAPVLGAHAIGIDDVIDLTEADLASFGIASPDRKRLLEAIAALRQSLAGARANPPDHQASRERWRVALSADR